MYGPAPWLQDHWDWRAAGNFIGGGTGTGLVIAGAFAGLADLPFAPFALPALAFVAAGLTLVWLEIGKPWRAIHVFFNPKTSWMTRESLVAPLLFATALAGAFFGWPWAIVLAALFATGFLYCQGRILMASKGIPAWREPRIVPLIIATGLTEGTGLFLAISAIVATPPVGAMATLFGLIALRTTAWLQYRRKLAAGGAPAGALKALDEAGRWVLGLGLALPAALLLGAAAWPAGTEGLAAAAGLAAMAGGWVMKFAIVTRAAFNQGFAIPRAPVRGAGKGGPGAKPGWN